jgi:hypothetical protein
MSYRDPRTYKIDGKTVTLTPQFHWENDEDQLVGYRVRMEGKPLFTMEAEWDSDFPTTLQLRHTLSRKHLAKWEPAHQHAYEVEELEASVRGLKEWLARSEATAKTLRDAVPTAVQTATARAEQAEKTVEVMRRQVADAQAKLAEKIAAPAQ